MIRYVLLAAALLSINPITDWLVDRQFKQGHERHRYSHTELADMNKLVERELRPKPGGRHKPMTSEEQRIALMELGWGGK